MKFKAGINEGISNSEYHGNKTHLSSSSLKKVLKDLEGFHREHILGFRKAEEEKPHLTEGTLTHSLILEPEKVAEEFAFFEGMRKQGKEYEEFAEANAGKYIISKPQRVRCNNYLEGYNRRPEAAELLKGGAAELTLCGQILGVDLKVRPDYINWVDGYIVDVKTMRYESGIDNFRLALEEYMYQLSASLYCQIAAEIYGKLFDFYFVVISKADFECNVYKCSSETLELGHALVNRAVIKYKKALATNIWTNHSTSAKLKQIGDYEIELI